MKYFFKLVTVSLLCICFAFISNYMPNLGQAISNAVFETFDGAQFLFVIGVAVCMMIILRKLLILQGLIPLKAIK